MSAQGYRYDLFVSYCRDEEVQQWVRRHLVTVLTQELRGERGSAAIYVDDQIAVGGSWPDELAEALHRSKVLLAVLTPRYFHSEWCQTEWHTFRRRQERVGIRPGVAPLVYPIQFSDGDKFQDEVGTIQQEMCFKDFNFPEPQFAQSQRFLDFRLHVRGVARRLTPRLDDPPTWKDDWPVDRRDQQPPPPNPRPVL